MPETLKGGGDCRVTVKGWAVIGSSGKGHVFAAGMGINPFDDDHKYIDRHVRGRSCRCILLHPDDCPCIPPVIHIMINYHILVFHRVV